MVVMMRRMKMSLMKVVSLSFKLCCFFLQQLCLVSLD